MDELFINASEIVNLCKKHGVTIGFAESLTGGMIASGIVSVPGSSEILQGSIVSYTNKVKINVLGVDDGIINTVGPVSEQCAIQMASGAKRLLSCDYAVSVTGVAGPTGGDDINPVGTVYIGVADRTNTKAYRFSFSGDRNQVRTSTVLSAYNLLKEVIING